MDCFILIVEENKFGTSSSNQVLIKLLNEVFSGVDKPNNEIGFAYEETNTFPKLYYFNTSNRDHVNKLKIKYAVIEGDFSIRFTKQNDYQYLGNYNLLPFKL